MNFPVYTPRMTKIREIAYLYGFANPDLIDVESMEARLLRELPDITEEEWAAAWKRLREEHEMALVEGATGGD